MSFCACSILYSFFYRYYAIQGRLKFLQSLRGLLILVLISIICPIPLALIMIIYDDPREIILSDVLSRFPGIFPIFSTNACHGVRPKNELYIYAAIIVIEIIVVFTLALFICYKTIKLLRERQHIISQRTYRLHCQLLIALFFQCSIPLLFLILPIVGIVVLFFVKSPYIKRK